MHQVSVLKRASKMIRIRMRIVRGFIAKSYLRALSTKDSMDYDNIMIIAPHPDDEVFGCGGLISLARSHGNRVSIVFITNGGAAHSGCCNISPERLGLIRRRTAVRANSILGVDESNLTWLNVPDGEIPDTHHPDFKRLCNLIAQQFLRINPRVVMATHFMDVWPDHVATNHLVQAALAIYGKPVICYYYPSWLLLKTRLRDFLKLSQLKVVCVDIDAVVGTKEEAIKCYLSDINSICGKPYCGALPLGFVGLLRGQYELFFTRKQ